MTSTRPCIEPKQLAEILAMLQANYPSFQPSQLTASVWFEALRDIPYEILVQATSIHVRDVKYPPNPASLREIVFGREERVAIPATDCWNRKVLRSDGSPAIEGYEIKRVGGLMEMPATDHEQLEAPESNRISGPEKANWFEDLPGEG